MYGCLRLPTDVVKIPYGRPWTTVSNTGTRCTLDDGAQYRYKVHRGRRCPIQIQGAPWMTVPNTGTRCTVDDGVQYRYKVHLGRRCPIFDWRLYIFGGTPCVPCSALKRIYNSNPYYCWQRLSYKQIIDI